MQGYFISERIKRFIIGLCLFFFFYQAFSSFGADEEDYSWNVFGQPISTRAQVVSKGFELSLGFHVDYITQLNNRNDDNNTEYKSMSIGRVLFIVKFEIFDGILQSN